MSNTCRICRHPERTRIEEALLRGEPLRAIAAREKVGRGSLSRHKRNCLKATLPVLAEVVTIPAGPDFDELIADMRRAKAVVWQIVNDTVELSTERRDCLAALRQIDGKIELLGKLEVARAEQRQAAPDGLWPMPDLVGALQAADRKLAELTDAEAGRRILALMQANNEN